MGQRAWSRELRAQGREPGEEKNDDKFSETNKIKQ
jgi:hypothetical protein